MADSEFRAFTHADKALVGYSELAYAYGKPPGSALLKQQPEDFQVDEELGFEASGAGEHLLLRLRKRDLGTTQVAAILARRLQIAPVDIGYSGMKDRRAVTTQWFSVPKKAFQKLQGESLDSQGLQLLEQRENDRKLKIGSHRANHFKILLRNFSGEPPELHKRLEAVRTGGVPNYFGPQRLGRDLSNVRQAQETFQAFDENREGKRLPRKKKSMLLSASRSYLFNEILSRRVLDTSWNSLLAGEVLNLAGTKRFFKAPSGEEPQLRKRLAALDIHPTGLLAGRAAAKDCYLADQAVAALESSVLSAYPELHRGLCVMGVMAGRRALRLVPGEVAGTVATNDDSLQLSFTLPAGGYATALLRELVQVQ